MDSDNARRRYFVAEGEMAEVLKKQIHEMNLAHKKRTKEFLDEFGATLCMQHNGIPSAILLKDGSAIPDGFKQECKRLHDGIFYIQLKPVGNKKVGKEIKKKMLAVGTFNVSDIILKYYGCNRMIYTSGSMWCSVGWLHSKKGIVVIQVPESDDEPYLPHETFKEIKKSEYIAITEE